MGTVRLQGLREVAEARPDDDEQGIRSTDTLGGKPWFVAVDVCAALEIGNVSLPDTRRRWH